MYIDYHCIENVLDIYVFFNELEKAYGLSYVHVVPDPLSAAQGFEFKQHDHGLLKKEEDGRNLQYRAYGLAFIGEADCDRFIEGFTQELGLLWRFQCVYCKTGDNTAVVVFNTVDLDGHEFGDFEERRFLSLFK